MQRITRGKVDAIMKKKGLKDHFICISGLRVTTFENFAKENEGSYDGDYPELEMNIDLRECLYSIQALYFFCVPQN